jgi:hypothetical protein
MISPSSRDGKHFLTSFINIVLQAAARQQQKKPLQGGKRSRRDRCPYFNNFEME